MILSFQDGWLKMNVIDLSIKREPTQDMWISGRHIKSMRDIGSRKTPKPKSKNRFWKNMKCLQ
jgi:hypothetical protein